MRVSPEHKVYASSMYNKEEMTTNYSVVERADDISFVEMPNPNLNIRDSYVQNLSDFERQRATKSSSLECLPNNSFALTIYESNSSEGMNVILSKISIENVSNSSEESFDFDNISGLCSKNSSLSFNGANICKLISNKSLRISPLEISVLNKTFESITTSIYIKPFFLKSLCIDNLTLSDNSSASFSVNLLFDIISRAIDNFNLSTISFTTLANASSNSFLNLSGISNLTIISSMKSNNDKDYKKLAIKTNFSLQPIKEIYEQINNGEYIYFLNSENKPIKVKSIEKVSYSGKIYDVDISCEIYKKKLRLDALKRSGT